MIPLKNKKEVISLPEHNLVILVPIYPLWHIWCFEWNFMNCWIYYHEIWLRHSQNFRISISSNAYWSTPITEQLECWIYPPPLCFFFYPEQNLDVEFQMQKVSTFLFDSSHWYWIHKSCQPTQIFHGHFKRCKRVISPPHHLKKAQQQKWKTAKMTIFSYFKKGTW